MRRFVLLLSIVVLGCGGSGGGSGGTSAKGRLQSGDAVSNNRYYDGYRFRVDESGPATFGLSSSDFDPYLVLGDIDGNLIDEDDDSGTGLNSLLTYYGSNGEELLVVVTSSLTASSGKYTLAWSSNVRKVEQVTSMTPQQIKDWSELHTKDAAGR